MSQAIHQAQAVRRILSDASLPIGERPQRALAAFGEIEFKKLDEALLDECGADLDEMHAVLDESKRLLAQRETTLNELHADLEQTRTADNESAQATDQTGVTLDKELLERCKVLLNPVASLDQRLLEVLDSAASRIVEAELDRIVAELDVGVRVLPEGAVIEAREHRELMVPRLMGVIRDAIAAARKGEVPEGQAHFFAIFLLTEFQAEEAFGVMLEGFLLPGDGPFDLFGDAVHEVLKRMLALFRGRQPDAIEALLDDRTLNMYVRWQAASSFLYSVRDGQIGRDEAVRRLQRCLRRAIDGNDEDIAGPLVCELLDYGPVEALADIREAFERGLVDEMLVDMRTVERFLAEGPSRLQEVIDRRGPAAIDTLEELRNWAAFRPERAARRAGKLAPRLPLEAVLPAVHFEADEEPYSAKREPIVASAPRVGRNDPCPCGSGKKFKKCCGARG